MGSSETILEIKDLAIEAGGKKLAEGFNASLARGELVAVIGQSGCGKTTLLRAACGLIDPAGGTVLLEGKTPQETGWPEFRRQVIYVEQRPILLDDTVEINLARPFQYKAQDRDFPRKEATDLLERLRLGEDVLAKRASSLSEGERQRVSIIRALLMFPKVLLLDEPTSALDPENVELVEDLITERARQEGMAGLIVTHQQNRARAWAGRLLDLGDFLAPGASCLVDRPNEAGHA